MNAILGNVKSVFGNNEFFSLYWQFAKDIYMIYGKCNWYKFPDFMLVETHEEYLNLNYKAYTSNENIESTSSKVRTRVTG